MNFMRFFNALLIENHFNNVHYQNVIKMLLNQKLETLSKNSFSNIAMQLINIFSMNFHAYFSIFTYIFRTWFEIKFMNIRICQKIFFKNRVFVKKLQMFIKIMRNKNRKFFVWIFLFEKNVHIFAKLLKIEKSLFDETFLNIAFMSLRLSHMKNMIKTHKKHFLLNLCLFFDSWRNSMWKMKILKNLWITSRKSSMIEKKSNVTIQILTTHIIRR